MNRDAKWIGLCRTLAKRVGIVRAESWIRLVVMAERRRQLPSLRHFVFVTTLYDPIRVHVIGAAG